MLLLMAALTLVHQGVVGNDVFGKYLRTNLTTKPTCDKQGEKYLYITPRRIAWEDGNVQDIVRVEIGGRDHYHLWVKDGQSGKVVLYGVFVDRKYDNAIVISDERVEVQAQIDQPNVADVGIVGYARCP